MSPCDVVTKKGALLNELSEAAGRRWPQFFEFSDGFESELWASKPTTPTANNETEKSLFLIPPHIVKTVTKPNRKIVL